MAALEAEFPGCMHGFSAALHREMVDPLNVEISLPLKDWFTLYSALERKSPAFTQPIDGRFPADQFRYMGIIFKVRSK